VSPDKTYRLADLENGEFAGTPLAVLGHPVEHSISPAMHNAALEEMSDGESRFKDWRYYRFDVDPDDLPEALPRFHRKAFLGLNLTLPHKVRALDEVRGISPDAQRMGAVNTLVWDEFGYDGFNTDGYGLKTAIERDLGFGLEGRAVVLLGSGGAARAAAAQCLIDGCERLCIGNRTPERVDELIDALAPVDPDGRASRFALGDPPDDLPAEGVLVNATSLGLRPDDPLPFDLARLGPGWGVYDMIYNPPATPLLQEASRLGLRNANGLSMLVHQGARSLEIWTHAAAPAQTMMQAACRALDVPPRHA